MSKFSFNSQAHELLLWLSSISGTNFPILQKLVDISIEKCKQGISKKNNLFSKNCDFLKRWICKQVWEEGALTCSLDANVMDHSCRYFQSLLPLIQFYCGNTVLKYLQKNTILSTSRKLKSALKFCFIFWLTL